MSEMRKLKEAFDRSRLAAVHVDLQCAYFREETMFAYPVANDLAASLRDYGVKNHWVAYTRDWAVRTPAQFAQKYSQHHNKALNFHRTIKVDENERVFEKALQGAFDNRHAPLYRSLIDDRHDTLIITGVTHKHCVAETIAGAMSKRFRIFAAVDATDCSMGDFPLWRQEILCLLNDASLNHLLTITTSHAIKQTLSP